MFLLTYLLTKLAYSDRLFCNLHSVGFETLYRVISHLTSRSRKMCHPQTPIASERIIDSLRIDDLEYKYT